MRIALSLFSAAFITLVLFYIMIGLVRTDRLPPIDMQAPTLVQIESIQDSDKSKTKKAENKEAPKPDVLPKLNTRKLVDSNNKQDIDIQLQLEPPSIKLEPKETITQKKNWVQPTRIDSRTANMSDLDGDIADQKSIRKVIPVGTRMPNVPKIAWDNKINGWVRLAFTVTSAGKVKDIRIIDASPKGVFEENAVSAAKKWRYQGFIGHDRYVTQKIEFEWKNYPYNLDY